MQDRNARPALAATLVCMAVGWLLGITLQLQQAALWSSRATALLGLGALLFIALPGRWRRHAAGIVWLGLAVGAVGFASTSLRADWRLSDALTPALEGQDIEVTGLVAELPQRTAQGTRFVFEPESASLRGAEVRVPARLALGWYRSADDDSLLASAAPELRAGQRWRLALRLRAPHGSLNPQGFDTELWFFEQGIGASGSVRARPEPQRLAERQGHGVERLRQTLRDAIVARVADPAAAGVLAALAIGDQAAIDREGWELYRNTGVAHLMSISGLHVTMFACSQARCSRGCGAFIRACRCAARRPWWHCGAAGSRQRLTRCSPAGGCRRSARCG